MSDKIDQRLITVVNAIKQAIETGVSPGLSVNRHPNLFFLHVMGEIDLKRAAENVLQRLDSYDAHLREQAAKVAAATPAASDPTIL